LLKPGADCDIEGLTLHDQVVDVRLRRSIVAAVPAKDCGGRDEIAVSSNYIIRCDGSVSATLERLSA